ncbi:UBN2_3 domain-containing protein, partial [Cephalotus follicularis]
KVGFIYGHCKKPATNSPLFHQWERCNAIVLSWIMNTMSKELFTRIVYATDAENVWKDLKERYVKVNGSRILSLHREIGSLNQGNTTVSIYYTKLKQLCDEYASLVTLPSCGCETSKAYLEHDQQLKLLQFLIGLNESYNSLRSQMLMMSPLRSVGQSYSIISQEES